MSKGMSCPICGAKSKVDSTVQKVDGKKTVLKRYRHCVDCQYHFTTTERA